MVKKIKVCFALFLLLFIPFKLKAVDYIVDSTGDDAVDVDTNCALVGLECTLRAAIQQVNISADLVNNISFSLPGGSTITLMTSGVDEDAAVTGDLDITNNVNIIGNSNNLITIDGNALDRVFHIQGSVTVNISGIRISNGSLTDDDGLGFDDGAGLYVEGDSILTIEDCEISNNILEDASVDPQRGGGLAVFDSDLYMSRCLVANNENNFGGRGGGLSIVFLVTDVYQVLIENSTISGNLIKNGNGSGGGVSVLYGGIFPDSPEVSVINSTITENEAGAGAGGLSGFFNIKNNIVVGNFSGGQPSDINSNNLVSQGGNVVGVSSTATNNNDDQIGNLTFPVEVPLGALNNNGGPTFTHLPLSHSPSINAGLDCLAEDQTGSTRNTNICDSGALEVLTICGDNTIDDNEECDLGSDNGRLESSCTFQCRNKLGGEPDPLCTNGVIDGDFEECDDGDNNNSNECSNLCQINTSNNAVCGNGTQESLEECDDGNTIDDDECSNTCLINQNIVDPPADGGGGCSLSNQSTTSAAFYLIALAILMGLFAVSYRGVKKN